MEILSHREKRRFGYEYRIRWGKRHLHIIFLHRNICLHIWRRKDYKVGIRSLGFSFSNMFDSLDKLEGKHELRPYQKEILDKYKETIED